MEKRHILNDEMIITDPRKCPHCGKGFDAVADLNGVDTLPKPGDYSICFECFGFFKFDDSMSTLKISNDQLLKENPEVFYFLRNMQQRAVAAIMSGQLTA